jgi:hypothetical protein
MRKRLVLLAIAAMCQTGIASLTVKAQAALRTCGVVWATNHWGSRSSFRVKAQGMSCYSARGIARSFWIKLSDFKPGLRVAFGRYTCVTLRYWSPPQAAWTCFRGYQRSTAYWMPETFEGE